MLKLTDLQKKLRNSSFIKNEFFNKIKILFEKCSKLDEFLLTFSYLSEDIGESVSNEISAISSNRSFCVEYFKEEDMFYIHRIDQLQSVKFV